LHDGIDGRGPGFFQAESEVKSAKIVALALVVLLGGFFGIWKLQHSIDKQQAALKEEHDYVLLSSAKLMKTMSLEFAPLLADFYWTRVVQFYGNKHVRGDANLEELWPLLDITTTLDPNLIPAYRFGAIFLSQRAPGGAGRPDLAVQLLQRGVKANPDYWRLYEDLGFVYYMDLKDYNKASAAFLEGSKNPKALIWMKIMAAKVAAQGESYETSFFLWNDIYTTTTDKQIKENAKTHLLLLRVTEDCKKLDQAADEYEKRFGHRPKRVSELNQAGVLQGEAVDPLGYAYVFDDKGKAALNLKSPLLEKQLMLEHFK
jgi:tetratricopeptide (TPR) repeat protein